MKKIIKYTLCLFAAHGEIIAAISENSPQTDGFFSVSKNCLVLNRADTTQRKGNLFSQQDQGANSPIPQMSGDTAFISAAQSGNMDELKSIIEQKSLCPQIHGWSIEPRKSSPIIISPNESLSPAMVKNLPNGNSETGKYLPNQATINIAFCQASLFGKLDVLNYLIERHEGVSLPDQDSIDFAFSLAASHAFASTLSSKENIANVSIMDWFRGLPVDVSILTQKATKCALNRVVSHAFHENQCAVVRYLLMPQAGLPLPDQSSMNEALSVATSLGAQCLFERREGGAPLPDQDGMKMAIDSNPRSGFRTLYTQDYKSIEHLFDAANPDNIVYLDNTVVG